LAGNCVELRLAEEADHQVLVDELGADFERAGFGAVERETELEVEAEGGGLGARDAEEDLLKGGVFGGTVDNGGEEGAGEAATTPGSGEEDADQVAFVALFALFAAQEGGDAGELDGGSGGSAHEEAKGEVAVG